MENDRSSENAEHEQSTPLSGPNHHSSPGKAADPAYVGEFDTGPPYPPDTRIVKNVSWLYLLLFLLLIAAGSVMQVLYFEIGILATQLLLILLPAILFLRFHGRLNRKFTRLKIFKLRQLPALCMIMVSALILVLSYGVILGFFLDHVGWSIPEFLPPPLTLEMLLYYYFLIALLPGICEEFLFRGTIMPFLERQGVLAALFFSSLLFAAFHLSLVRLPGTFLLGFVIGLVVIKTGSLLAGMFLHVFNNALAVSFMYIAAKAIPHQVDSPATAPGGVMIFLFLAPLAASGLFLGFKIMGGRPVLLPGEKLLPQGWWNPALILALLLFAIMVTLEILILSGMLEEMLRVYLTL